MPHYDCRMSRAFCEPGGAKLGHRYCRETRALLIILVLLLWIEWWVYCHPWLISDLQHGRRIDHEPICYRRMVLENASAKWQNDEYLLTTKNQQINDCAKLCSQNKLMSLLMYWSKAAKVNSPPPPNQAKMKPTCHRHQRLWGWRTMRHDELQIGR